MGVGLHSDRLTESIRKINSLIAKEKFNEEAKFWGRAKKEPTEGKVAVAVEGPSNEGTYYEEKRRPWKKGDRLSCYWFRQRNFHRSQT